MALQNANTQWILGSYTNDRNDEIKRSENDPLRVSGQPLGLHRDHLGRPAIGYGVDLLARSASTSATLLNPYLAPGESKRARGSVESKGVRS